MAKNPKNAVAEEQDDGIREKMIAVNRVTKVVKGGRILGFAALTVVGDGDGRIGMGKGKSREVPVSVQKAMDQARRAMGRILADEAPVEADLVLGVPDSGVPAALGYSEASGIPFTDGASRVMLHPAPEGTGVIAGGPMRAIFDVMGIRNIVAKSHGSSNPYNMVRATLDALSKLRSPSEIAAKRGKTVEELIG